MPARIICSITSGESEAGPSVQTILVLLLGSFMLKDTPFFNPPIPEDVKKSHHISAVLVS